VWGAERSLAGPGLVACGRDDDWLWSGVHSVGPAGVENGVRELK
jgi:hypothetical protein